MNVRERVIDVGDTKRDNRDRLRRIQGQMRGIQRVTAKRRQGEDIITQLLAVRTAVDKVAEGLISERIDECLASLPPDRTKSEIGRAVHPLNRIS